MFLDPYLFAKQKGVCSFNGRTSRMQKLGAFERSSRERWTWSCRLLRKDATSEVEPNENTDLSDDSGTVIPWTNNQIELSFLFGKHTKFHLKEFINQKSILHQLAEVRERLIHLSISVLSAYVGREVRSSNST